MNAEESFVRQLREIRRTYKRFSKLRLIGELRESDRIIKADAKQIFELGERIKKLEAGLREIIESEHAQAIGSYGLGDIARAALDGWKNEFGNGPETHINLDV